MIEYPPEPIIPCDRRSVLEWVLAQPQYRHSFRMAQLRFYGQTLSSRHVGPLGQKVQAARRWIAHREGGKWVTEGNKNKELFHIFIREGR